MVLLQKVHQNRILTNLKILISTLKQDLNKNYHKTEAKKFGHDQQKGLVVSS